MYGLLNLKGGENLSVIKRFKSEAKASEVTAEECRIRLKAEMKRTVLVGGKAWQKRRS